MQFAFDNDRGEVRLILKRKFHNEGSISDTLKEVMRFGYDKLNLNCIKAILDVGNIASKKLSEKNKFVQEGQLRDYILEDGMYYDVYVYSMLAREFKTLYK